MMTATQLIDQLKDQFWAKVCLIAAMYLGLQATVLAISPTGWAKFWVLQSPDNFQYWDAGIYAKLALSPACTAFYPLWPHLIRWFSAPANLSQTMRFATLFSELLFLASIPIALFTFEKILKNKPVAFLSVFLYALGPNSIFHSIGYTESLFGLLSLLFLLTIHIIEAQKYRSRLTAICFYSVLFAISVLLSLARPILLQAYFAIFFALAVTFGGSLMTTEARNCTSTNVRALPAYFVRFAGVIGVGSLLGYSLYGWYCWQTTGDFLTPFRAQVEWGRTLGFRPWLLIFPRTLLIDIYGLYTPALLITALLGMLCWSDRDTKSLQLPLPKNPWLYVFLIHPLVFIGVVFGLSCYAQRLIRFIQLPGTSSRLTYLGRFSILFAIAFSGVHSLINFLANTGNLYSTARHFFGTPFAFVGIGAILTALSLPNLTRLTWILAWVGVVLLAEQWLSYADNGWLG